MFTAVSTSALNVESVVKAGQRKQYTVEFILERNRLNVLLVANDLQLQVTLLSTAEFTVDRNCTNVTCVTRHLVRLEI